MRYNPEIRATLDKINKTWGGEFEISFIDRLEKGHKEKERFY